MLLLAGAFGASLVGLTEIVNANGDWWLPLVAIMSSGCAGSALALYERWTRNDTDRFL